jgi:hypothetical protein
MFRVIQVGSSTSIWHCHTNHDCCRLQFLVRPLSLSGRLVSVES